VIDVDVATGTFAGTHQLAVDLATAVMTIEQVPDIATFRKNTAAFVHDLDAGCLANVDGDSNCVRVQVLTNCGAPDRDKQLAVVGQLTDIIATAAGDATLVPRGGSDGRDGGGDLASLPPGRPGQMAVRPPSAAMTAPVT
jgi:hypothetical protein